MSNKVQNVITIDGPAGSGKSTVAHILAKQLNWTHVNTGAIYRTFAYLLNLNSKNNLPHEKDHGLVEETVSTIAKTIDELYRQDDENHQFYLGEQNITQDLYLPHVSNFSSIYAQSPVVREKLLPIQRKITEQYPGVIVDGRDMGTIVFPDAPLKIFLTANVETRAKRRLAELQARSLDVNYDTILEELKERDLRDSTRSIAPTKPAFDAITIDSSDHTIDEIVDKILLLYRGLQESST